MKALIVTITTYLLRAVRLSDRDRLKLTNVVLDKLSAKPLRDIIYVNDDGELVIQGKSVDREKTIMLRESAKMALSNQALTLIREQVLYQAYVTAAHSAKSESDLIFGKAAIWYGKMEDDKLKLIASYGDLATTS